MSQRVSDAFGRSIVSYPFMVMALAVIVAIEITRNTEVSGFVGWLIWASIWLAIAALGAGLFIIPILAAELLLWTFVTERFGWLEATRSGAIISALLLGLPWAAAPQANRSGALLIAAGLILARIAVPSLRPGRTEADA